MKGSKNQEKARQRLALQEEKVRHTRLDYYRKIASRIARDNQGVILETLSAKTMMRNRYLAKSVQDASIGILIQAIRNACERNGVDFRQINRWQPTTKVCSQCDTKRESVPLDVREWQCLHCHARLDRDWNAAVNILLAGGTTESQNACGGVRTVALVREPAIQETGTHQDTVITV